MIIIDVRTREEHASSHTEGAICIPLDEIATSNLGGVDFEEKIGLCCRSGARANVARMILMQRGFKNVTLYNEGRCK